MRRTDLTEHSFSSLSKATGPNAALSEGLRKVVIQAERASRGIPVAASAEDAIWLLQERARAEREGKVAVQAGLLRD